MFIPGGSAIETGGYNVNNSLRFRASASASLTRTFSTPTNNRKWTMSLWVKRGALGQGQIFAKGNTSTAPWTLFYFDSNNALNLYEYSLTGTAANFNLATNAVFRDPSAWYHIVVAVDTTLATAANRQIVYVNNVQQTFSSASYYPQNTDTQWNSSGGTSYIFQQGAGATTYLDGYLAETHFVDGQQLTPSSFGATDAVTGVWAPAAYTGSYGTNGFYLKFSDIATTSGSNAGLGKDFSGNGNYWTTNNISVTAGTTYDAMTDSPTLTSSTVANYAVMNPLSSASGTLTNGNLTFSNAGAVKGAMGTFGLESGKWYWENTITTLGANDLGVGILFNNATAGMRDGTVTSTFSVFYQANTNVRKNGTIVANYASYTTGDIIGIAYDADTRSITFYKNNTLQGSITADAPTSPYVVWIIQPNTITATVNANFGQQPFSYTPPTGFNRLNAFNLPNSTVVKGNTVMDATLYTGNGYPTSGTQTITNAAGFKSDLIWIKRRDSGGSHTLTDSVRGVNSQLFTNVTSAQETNTDDVTAFNSNGFSLGTGTTGTYPSVNSNGGTYVAWQWQAGQGSTSSNTQGSITSTVSVNTTAGFSVVTYTGTGANATVGHGLGVAPKMVIVKSRTTAENWMVYHTSIGATKYIYLDSTGVPVTLSTIWNNTEPTSSVFSIGTNVTVNQSSTNYVAYCWAEIAGYSKFGSYTGNGSTDGSFIYLGFRPKFVLFRNITTAGYSWQILDTSRNTYNTMNAQLFPNSSVAQDTTNVLVDYLSNGIKLRNGDGAQNLNSNTYIYMAFAENPFKNALAR